MLKKLFAIALSALVFNAYADAPVAAQSTPNGQSKEPIQVAQGAPEGGGAGPATTAAAGGISGATIGVILGAVLLGAAVTGGGDDNPVSGTAGTTGTTGTAN